MLRGNRPNTLRCGNQLLEITSPVVMGILNVTPDSFYPASRLNGDIKLVLESAEKMLEEGASILDVGGMSTRPGSPQISADEELKRVVPVIKGIHQKFPEAIISVDTYRATVAHQSILAGATMVNDISGGQLDEGMIDVVADSGVAYVLMHMRGTPMDMQTRTDYTDLIGELIKYFVEKLRVLHQRGIHDIVIDPGFGFSKTMEQNYELINRLGVFHFLDHPVMVGVSRKSTLSATINRPVEDTLAATTALHMMALFNGAIILRVHDVRPAMDAIAVFNQLISGNTLKNKSLDPV